MPLYNLKDVKLAAKSGKITYRGSGRKVYNDISNLGYESSDVKDCFLQLSESDYKETKNYEDQPPDDVYILNYVRFDEDGDELAPDCLYIKFRLKNSILEINLGSFHV